ncbi:MAG: DUF2007 domain-containing protein [bacterium]|jgi:hypothetical protein|nr:DUF2007 domain-containing protein [bacterium]
MENPEEKLIAIYTTLDAIQEALIRGALEEAGIQYLVRSYHDLAMDGMYEKTFGHSQILVFEHQLAEAKQMIDDLALDQS